MQGPIAQAVALAGHANATLRGLDRPPFFPGNSTCRFCEWVRFVDAERSPRGTWTERPVAADPDEWFASLARRGVRRVRLAYEPSGGWMGPDFRTVGFTGGGGAWWILCESDGPRADRWRSRWTVGNRDAPDHRIWQVDYGRLGDAPTATEGPTIAKAAEDLERSLEEISRFSRHRANGHFLEAFEKGLETLRTGVPRGYHQDLAPAGALSPEAVRLLDACQVAWVFGGMGWWNDQSFEGEAAREFDRVTGAHWAALSAAIVAGANASASSAGSRPAG